MLIKHNCNYKLLLHTDLVVCGIFLILFHGSSFAQEIVSLYNAVEEQLISLRASVDQLQTDINALNAQVEAIGQSQQQMGSFDQAVIEKLRETQEKKSQDLAQLLTARDLWQKNFGVVNKTFANLRKKFAI